MYVIGIDPGPTPGVVRLNLVTRPQRPRELVGISFAQPPAADLLDTLTAYAIGDYVTVAIERFVVGSRAARSAGANAGTQTREMIGWVEAWADAYGHRVVRRSASEVKPWATDARLAAVGLIDPTRGKQHARDAARHALFCAVRNYGLPDPLSRAGGAS